MNLACVNFPTDVGRCKHLFLKSEPKPDDARRYHHGDLRNALVKAVAHLAEEGGPSAVTIRGAARAVGVTPTAIYRHFANQTELLEAAKNEAVDRLAATILEFLSAEKPATNPAEEAAQRLVAVGRGYIHFALAQPGLFRTAFLRSLSGAEPSPKEMSGTLAEALPYAYLTTTLDHMVEVGRLPAELRPSAETAAWATIHGLAVLLIESPYRLVHDTERERLISRTLDMVVRGLSGGPNSDTPLHFA